jgi:hypothetical protein
MSLLHARSGRVGLTAALLLVLADPTAAQPYWYRTPYIGGMGGWGWPGARYPGFGPGGVGFGVGQALQGAAALTRAQGDYWNSIQQARILREQSRQMAIDTQRKQLEWEREYEESRPTAQQLIAQRQATDLERARENASNTEIWSGRTLNILLHSILRTPDPTQGPYIPLDPNVLRGLNLTDPQVRGNVALAKDQGRIAWTEALQDAAFDTVRGRFSRTFAAAMKSVESGQPPAVETLRELRADLQTLNDKLEERVQDLPPHVSSNRAACSISFRTTSEGCPIQNYSASRGATGGTTCPPSPTWSAICGGMDWSSVRPWRPETSRHTFRFTSRCVTTRWRWRDRLRGRHCRRDEPGDEREPGVSLDDQSAP